MHHCAPDLLENTDLIVLPMPADSDTHFGAVVQVLKECLHPVLFVPSTDGIVERSTS
jgi:LmbE family N-acetylglucosaminyl deacetylase